MTMTVDCSVNHQIAIMFSKVDNLKRRASVSEAWYKSRCHGVFSYLKYLVWVETCLGLL